MSLFYNIPVKTTTKVYTVKVCTADGYEYEYTLNASSAKEAQMMGFRKTDQYYRECGLRFYPTKMTAGPQGFLAI